MMQLVRNGTLEMVQGLNRAQLDFEPDPQANSIGSLLMHIGALEFFVIRNMFNHRPLAPGEAQKWTPALSQHLHRKAIRENELPYYINALEEVRKETLGLLQQVDDSWLYAEKPRSENVMVSNYYRIFHLFEDEISHSGQIRYIKKRIPVSLAATS
jgi:hypothetical protein